MAIYSVYNYDRRLYDYYEGPGPSGTHAGAPPLLSLGGIGATPDAAAWRLPAGSRKIGSGEMPRGRIASLGEFRAGDGLKLGMLGLSAYLAWRYLR